MKAHEFRDELFESLAYDTDANTLRQLTEMRDTFVRPYNVWLNNSLYATRLTEATAIDPTTYSKIMADFSAMTPAGKPTVASLTDVVPEKLQHQFYDKIPDAAHSKPVKGFADKIKSALAAVKDAAAKKELLKLAQTAIKNPDLQQLALIAVSGVAGAATLLATASPQAAGAVAGGLASIARAKMAGQDWKSAAKAGAKGAAMGLAAGAIGGLAAGVVGQLGHALMGDSGPAASAGDLTQYDTYEGPEEMLDALKKMARDGKITDWNSYNKAINDLVSHGDQTDPSLQQYDRRKLELLVNQTVKDNTAGTFNFRGLPAIVQQFVNLENPDAAKGFDPLVAAMPNQQNEQDSSRLLKNVAESVAVNYALRVLLEAEPTLTDEGLYLAQKKAGYSYDQIKSMFDKWGIPLPAIAAKDAKTTATSQAKPQAPAAPSTTAPAAPAAPSTTAPAAPAAPSTTAPAAPGTTAPAAPTTAQTQTPAIKTGDVALDNEVNNKLRKEGKAAAEAYLREIIWQERQQILSSAQGIRSEIAKLKPAQARQVIDILKAQNITEAIRSAHPNIIQQIALAVAKQKPNARVAIMQDLKLIAGIVSAKKPAPAQPAAAPAAPANPAVTPIAAPVAAPAGQVAEQRRKQ